MDSDNMTNTDLRKFGFIMGGFIALIFGLFFPWLLEKSIPWWPWIVAVLFAAVALVMPRLLIHVYRPWMWLGHKIGVFNSKIILGLVFFLIFTPMALLFALVGKDFMHREFGDKTKRSFWKDSHKQSKDHMENLY